MCRFFNASLVGVCNVIITFWPLFWLLLCNANTVVPFNFFPLGGLKNLLSTDKKMAMVILGFSEHSSSILVNAYLLPECWMLVSLNGFQTSLWEAKSRCTVSFLSYYCRDSLPMGAIFHWFACQALSVATNQRIWTKSSSRDASLL